MNDQTQHTRKQSLKEFVLYLHRQSRDYLRLLSVGMGAPWEVRMAAQWTADYICGDSDMIAEFYIYCKENELPAEQAAYLPGLEMQYSGFYQLLKQRGKL